MGDPPISGLYVSEAREKAEMGHLIVRQRRICEDKMRTRDDALSTIEELDVLEDTRPLSAKEHATRKKFRDGVA